MQVQKAKSGYKFVKSFPKYITMLIPTDWDFVSIKEILVKQNSGFHNRLERTEDGENIVGMVDLYNHTKIDGQKFLLAKFPFEDKKQYMLEEGDLIYVEISLVRTGVGKTLYVTKNGSGTYFAGNVRRFKVNEKCDPVFLYYLLNLDLFRNSIINRSYTTALTGITTKDYFRTIIPLPSKSIQQKIVSILSNVDSLIQQTNQLIERTKVLKKGMMQQLLTKGIAHTKFKKVKSLFGKYEEIPENWVFKQLGEIGEIVGGGTPDSTKQEYWNGEVLWAIPSDVTKLSSNFIEETERKISEKGLKESSAKLLPQGTILITSRATIGECVISKKPISTNQGFQNLICNEKNDNLYWFYAIKFHKKKLLRLSYGTTFLEISKNWIKKVLIPTTESKNEQQKISSILAKVDIRIEKLEKDKSNLSSLKKGLMQKLLTGQIRVKV